MKWIKENRTAIAFVIFLIICLILWFILKRKLVKASDLANKNVQAFIKMVRWSENKSAPDDATRYRTIVGGQMFTDLSKHPRKMQQIKLANGKIVPSDAAGAYQFLSTTWDEMSKATGVTDMSEPSQDLNALQQIADNDSFGDIVAGRLDKAIQKNANTWASLPGNNFDQSPNTVAALQQKFTDNGGVVNNQA